MRAHLHLRTATVLQIFNQLFAGLELGARWLIAIEISDKANAEADVVHVIAMDMAAAHLPNPAIADLDLAVSRRSAIADHEMIGEPVLHSPDPAMVVVKHLGASLPRPAVVNNDEFPA